MLCENTCAAMLAHVYRQMCIDMGNGMRDGHLLRHVHGHVYGRGCRVLTLRYLRTYKSAQMPYGSHVCVHVCMHEHTYAHMHPCMPTHMDGCSTRMTMAVTCSDVRWWFSRTELRTACVYKCIALDTCIAMCVALRIEMYMDMYMHGLVYRHVDIPATGCHDGVGHVHIYVST